MFGNMSANNYNDRVVDKFDDGNLFVSTAIVTDGRKLYETAVAHPDYNNNTMVIVECYDTKKEAQKAHNSWVASMLTEPLPTKLVDCGNSFISGLADSVGCNMEFPRQA